MGAKRRGLRSSAAPRLRLVTAIAAVALAATSIVAGCGKEASPPAPPPAPDAGLPDAAVAVDATPDAGPAPPQLPALEERPVTLKSAVKAEKIERRTVKGRVPAGWKPSGKQAFAGELGDDPFPPLISFGIACDGKCKPAEIEKAVARRVVEFTSSLATPGLDSDKSPAQNKKIKKSKQKAKPAPPSVRLDVTVIDQGDEAGRRFMVARVIKPPGVKGRYHDSLEALCTVHRRRDSFFVFTRVRAPLRYEATLWPLLLEACKATDY
jgi:hypothetical protein